jgi:hypothetical protein
MRCLRCEFRYRCPPRTQDWTWTWSIHTWQTEGPGKRGHAPAPPRSTRREGSQCLKGATGYQIQTTTEGLK